MGGVNIKGIRGEWEHLDWIAFMDIEAFPRDSRLMHKLMKLMKLNIFLAWLTDT